MKNLTLILFITTLSLSVNAKVKVKKCKSICAFEYNDANGTESGEVKQVLKAKSFSKKMCKKQLKKSCNQLKEDFLNKYAPDAILNRDGSVYLGNISPNL